MSKTVKPKVIKADLRARKAHFVTGLCPMCHQLTSLYYLMDEPEDQWHCLLCSRTFKDGLNRKHKVYKGKWMVEYWDAKKLRERQRTIMELDDLFDFIGYNGDNIIAIINLTHQVAEPLELKP